MLWHFRADPLPESGKRVPVWIVQSGTPDVLPAIFEASVDDPDEIWWKNPARDLAYDSIYAWMPRNGGEPAPEPLFPAEGFLSQCPDGTEHVWLREPYQDPDGNDAGITVVCGKCGWVGDSV